MERKLSDARCPNFYAARGVYYSGSKSFSSLVVDIKGEGPESFPEVNQGV